MPEWPAADVPNIPLAVAADVVERVSDRYNSQSPEPRIFAALAAAGIDLEAGPEAMTLEQAKKAAKAYEHIEVTLPASDVKMMMLSMTGIIAKLQAAESFAEYLEENGQGKHGRYLRSLVNTPIDYDGN